MISYNFLRISIVGAFFLFTIHASLVSVAQGLGNSPYSAIGVGETFSGGFAPNQMMGNTGVGVSNGIYINNLNPALLARNRNVTFEVGFLGQYKNLNDGSRQQQTAGGNLNYLTLGFPVNRRWTASIGLQPYSYMDSKITGLQAVQGSPYLADVTYTDKGGLNKVAITNGFQITKNLYLGLSAGYIFGATTNDASTRVGTGQIYSITRTSRTNYHDFLFKGGLAWRQKLKDKLYLTLAGTADFGTRINADQLVSNNIINPSGFTVAGTGADTVSRSAKGSVQLSPTYRVGFALENPYKLTFAVDFVYQQGSKFRDFGLPPVNKNNQRDSYTISVGTEYTPDISAATGYFKRVPYRLGFSYGTSPIYQYGQQLTEWSVTTGASFPLGRGGLSDINLGFQYGDRGKAGERLLREQYGRLILGFTLNDRWFQRLAID